MVKSRIWSPVRPYARRKIKKEKIKNRRLAGRDVC